MTRWIRLAVLAFVAVIVVQWWAQRPSPDAASYDSGASAAPRATETRAGVPSFLPPEALTTLELIERGGPFPYERDGSVFQNREQRLPGRPRGYYREYTVRTPGSPDRGARRIVAGGQPPEVYYYTDDHYGSFRRVEIDR
jgi:guanyl-specific ribonuclease Sa